MLECAEVLDLVLKAVEKGKKKLRIDFLPQQRILDFPKRWMKPEVVPEVEPDAETLQAEKEKKAEMVANFMERHEAYMYGKQEAIDAERAEEERKNIEIEERKKRKME